MKFTQSQLVDQAQTMAELFYMAQGLPKCPAWELLPPVTQDAFLAVAQRSLQNRVSMPVLAAVEIIALAELKQKLDASKTLDINAHITISVGEYRNLLIQAVQGLPPPL
jgi:hypothetical protein